jgi:DivIVA domain-containing protein
MAGGGSSGLPRDGDRGEGFGDVHSYVPQDVLDVSFPVAVRGYDRAAVDAYIKRVNRVIAELKVRSSPPAAVRHALEQAENKVQGLLQAAREAADEMTASAQTEADETLGRAKADAAELTVNTSAAADRVRAEAQLAVAHAREEADGIVADAKAEAQEILARAQAEADERLQRSQEELTALREEAEARRQEIMLDTDEVRRERHDLLEDIRHMAGELAGLANSAGSRIAIDDEVPDDEIAPTRAASDQQTQRLPVVERTDT